MFIASSGKPRAHLILDVSSFQGAINWHAVATMPGLAGVFVKASEGLTLNDPGFVQNRKGANAAGLRVGAYHFAHPELHPPDVEAKHFVSQVGKLAVRDLRPVLDLEVQKAIDKLGKDEVVAWARAWNRVVKNKLGVWPLFYSYSAYIAELGATVPIGGGLWLANYAQNDGIEHPYAVPAPWHTAAAHQFTSKAHVPGITGGVDLSSARSLVPLLAHPFLGRL